MNQDNTHDRAAAPQGPNPILSNPRAVYDAVRAERKRIGGNERTSFENVSDVLGAIQRLLCDSNGPGVGSEPVDRPLAVSPWCPDACPVTGRKFFMWLEHPTQGLVPTYGGPYDSYTLARRQGDTFHCERFDHDLGDWLDDVVEIDLRLIDNQREDCEHGTVEALQRQLAERQNCNVEGHAA